MRSFWRNRSSGLSANIASIRLSSTNADSFESLAMPLPIEREDTTSLTGVSAVVDRRARAGHHDLRHVDRKSAAASVSGRGVALFSPYAFARAGQWKPKTHDWDRSWEAGSDTLYSGAGFEENLARARLGLLPFCGGATLHALGATAEKKPNAAQYRHGAQRSFR